MSWRATNNSPDQFLMLFWWSRCCVVKFSVREVIFVQSHHIKNWVFSFHPLWRWFCVGFCRLVLEYCCWYTANIVNISVVDALSIGVGFVAAVSLCMKRELCWTLTWLILFSRHYDIKSFPFSTSFDSWKCTPCRYIRSPGHSPTSTTPTILSYWYHHCYQ